MGDLETQGDLETHGRSRSPEISKLRKFSIWATLKLFNLHRFWNLILVVQFFFHSQLSLALYKSVPRATGDEVDAVIYIRYISHVKQQQHNYVKD